MPSEYDVVVVGLGPTGATLANLLARHGLNILVLERESNLYDLPRAVHFDDETMRVFQTIGIADKLAKKVRVNPGMRFVDGEGDIILDWPRPQSITGQGWHASYRLHQPDLERLLRESLQSYTNCKVLTGAKLTSVVATTDQVKLVYQCGQHEYRERARFVVGCDGANSSVRQLMASGLKDFGYRERWLVVDVLLKSEMPSLGDHTIQYCDQDHAMTYCRNPGRRRRWEMSLPDDLPDSAAIDEQRIWEKLSRWVSPADAVIERKAVYTFRSAVADHWQQGRLLLAGDAAHLTPPFMGQGMCAGIRDASNLAWKLAATIRSQDNELLSTYQREREQNVTEYITTATRLGELIGSVDKQKAAALRTGDKRSTMASLAPAIGAHLEHWLNISAGKHCGALFPQPHLNEHTRLDDVVGYQFVLITSKQTVQLPMPVIKAKDHPELLSALHERDAIAILVRPDRYIAAIAGNEKELQQLEAVIRGKFASRIYEGVTSSLHSA